MALVSPGIQISINDQSQYVNANIGSVPLVVLATAQDKTYNGSAATGTSKANAGKLQSFTSQRDLVTAMGTPTFQLSSAGTPVNASEINEYGLMAAYSALGLGNQLYAIRADVDLDQLAGSGVRPVAAPADAQQWLDLANTVWGLNELDRTSATPGFTGITPLLLTSPTEVTTDSATFDPLTIPVPRNSVGTTGSYALVLVNEDGTSPTTIRLFYKATNLSTTDAYTGVSNANVWVMVGSPDWQRARHAAVSTGTITGTVGGSTGSDIRLTVNGTDITATDLGGTSATLTAAAVVDAINAKEIAGVHALTYGNPAKIYLFVTSDAVAGRLSISGAICGTGTGKINLGATSPTVTYYYPPYLHYGSYATEPSGGWGFATADASPRPTGSIWWKIGSTGNGFAPVYKKYSSSTGAWTTLTTPVYLYYSDALYGLDPTGGGFNIPVGTSFFHYGSDGITYNAMRVSAAEVTGAMVMTAAAFDPSENLSISDTFLIRATTPGTSTVNPNVTVTLTGTDAETVVQDILAAEVPYVSARVRNGLIELTHTSGGIIFLLPDPAGDANTLSYLGFTASGTGYTVSASTGAVTGSNLVNQTDHAKYNTSEPTNTPADGTYWYYSSPSDVDILVNTGTTWAGYISAGTDIRNYNLSATDPNGVIVSASQPSSQSDATALVSGDLWLDSSDLVNYPSLYRYNATTAKWTAIDNTDHTSSNGIIFADARWDTDGTSDVASDDLPLITDLLNSDYIDLDCPDPTLYPRGILLFNTRRSGYNVKRFVSNYYNNTSFDPQANSKGYPTTLPSVTDAWVTASGNNDNGVMNAGTKAQRAIVVAAMQAAVDSNLDVREDNFTFNLLAAPGYPELIDNLVMLNNDRANTGFVIGDTPMTLAPTATAITAWNNNTNGDGLATSDAYLGVYYPAGRTNDLDGNTVVVPASHAVLRTFLYNDNVSYPWFAPAGTHRGLISNLSDIGYVDAATGAFVHNSINQGLRDALYTQKINPLTQLPGTGLVVWGQVTKSGSSSARDRVNVVRLENFLRTAFKSIANGYLFEPNDAGTRKSIAAQIENALHDILSKRGLYDFLVICDTSNNTSSTIANNQLYVDVAIEPVRAVEFIYIPIAIYNPGQIATVG